MVSQQHHPEKLRLLLWSARIIDLGLSLEKFQEMVRLQERLKRIGYSLQPQDTELVDDIWQRTRQYVRELKPGYEHLIKLFVPWEGKGA